MGAEGQKIEFGQRVKIKCFPPFLSVAVQVPAHSHFQHGAMFIAFGNHGVSAQDRRLVFPQFRPVHGMNWLLMQETDHSNFTLSRREIEKGSDARNRQRPVDVSRSSGTGF